MKSAAFLAISMGIIMSLTSHFASAAGDQNDLTAAQAFAAAKAGELKLVDIRTPQEWKQTGIAPGAAVVDFYRGQEVLLREILQMVGGDKNAPIALICRTGNRTTQAQRLLQAQGFTRVYNVKEGMAGSAAGPGWLRQGLPTEQCLQC
jgi:rhodanese-related sulfurtransferase